ncbi:MAG: hypothetical protein HY924_10580 [Elusimicrobia bacterium]|nr:hypothetical protein [Elusimicrobiota bacterium]
MRFRPAAASLLCWTLLLAGTGSDASAAGIRLVGVKTSAPAGVSVTAVGSSLISVAGLGAPLGAGLAVPMAGGLPDQAVPSVTLQDDSALQALSAAVPAEGQRTPESATGGLIEGLARAVPPAEASLGAAVEKLQRLYSGPAAVADEEPEPSAQGLPEHLPIGWVRRRLDLSRSRSPAVLERQARVQKKGFRKEAVNPRVLSLHNDRYTMELPVGLVTDQKDSGRCWIFAGLNMLRSRLISQGKVRKDFEFSENHVYYFSQLERANRALETAAKKVYAKGKPGLAPETLETAAPDINDGGNFAAFQFLVEKYGLVPKSAMPETKSSGATTLLDRELNSSLGLTVRELAADSRRLARKGGESRARRIKEAGLERIVKILSAHLGVPPSRFDYAPKTKRSPKAKARSYTPRGFLKDFVRFDFDDYVQVASWPYRRRQVSYESQGSAFGTPRPGDRPVNYRFLNVDMDRLEALAVAGLESGQPVYVYAAMDRDADPRTGIMHPAVYDRASVYGLSEEPETGLTRLQSLALGLNTGNHLMVLTGFDRPEQGQPVVKFKVENSWGPKFGDRGVYHMYRGWFREHVFNIIVHKSLLSRPELAAWTSEARKLD